jgi:TnpA family transposase
MKKTLVSASVAIFFSVSCLSADALKNSLMSADKDDTPMVNLDNIKLDKKEQKSRADTAVVATINGTNITKEQADKYLALRTQGRMTDFDKLPGDKQKLALINEMAVPNLAAIEAQKELSAEEKNAAISRFWMQKKLSTTKVTDEEAKKAYDELVKRVKEAAKKQSVEEPKLPEFEKAKREIMLQLAQDKVTKALLEKGKVKLK